MSIADMPSIADAPGDTPPVLAAQTWTSNAELVADLFTLGYLDDESLTLDPTFGRGVWWKVRQPAKFIAHTRASGRPARMSATCPPVALRVSVDVRTGLSLPWDFRATGYADDTFDRITYDPPYVSRGGRTTSTLDDMNDRYGIDVAPSSPAELQQLIDDGLTEMVRILRPGGLVMVKCQDYVSSGRLWPGTHHTLTHALTLELELVDRLEHVGKAPRPQPAGRRQVHARRNLSTLFVLRKLTPKQAAKRAGQVAHDRLEATFAGRDDGIRQWPPPATDLPHRSDGRPGLLGGAS